MVLFGKHLVIVVCFALGCLTTLTIVAVALGHNGTLLMSVAGIFGVIIGALAKTIYEKKPS
jgi:hypothetical protein